MYRNSAAWRDTKMAARGQSLDARLKPNTAVICHICLKRPGKYTCPRCNVIYCTSECYKSEKHMQCSEAFYRDCFMEALKNQKTGDTEKAKTVEMLQKLEERNEADLDSDDEEEIRLEERLAGLDLDKDTIWDKLSKKEKEEFESMIEDGRMGHLVHNWSPWWLKQEDLVEEIGVSTSKCPEIKCDVHDLSALLSNKKPSENIKHNLISVLYAYVCVTRLNNGDTSTDPLEIAQEVLSLCQVIGQDRIFESTEEAIQDGINSVQKQECQSVREEFVISVIKDVELIIYGPKRGQSHGYSLAALSDLHTILVTASKLCSKVKKKADSKLPDLSNVKKQLFAARKKTEFYLSWLSSEYGACIFETLLPLKMLYAHKMTDFEKHNQTLTSLEDNLDQLRHNSQKKTLIEELL